MHANSLCSRPARKPVACFPSEAAKVSERAPRADESLANSPPMRKARRDRPPDDPHRGSTWSQSPKMMEGREVTGSAKSAGSNGSRSALGRVQESPINSIDASPTARTAKAMETIDCREQKSQRCIVDHSIEVYRQRLGVVVEEFDHCHSHRADSVRLVKMNLLRRFSPRERCGTDRGQHNCVLRRNSCSSSSMFTRSLLAFRPSTTRLSTTRTTSGSRKMNRSSSTWGG